jgi:hypothetical protein
VKGLEAVARISRHIRWKSEESVELRRREHYDTAEEQYQSRTLTALSPQEYVEEEKRKKRKSEQVAVQRA